ILSFDHDEDAGREGQHAKRHQNADYKVGDFAGPRLLGKQTHRIEDRQAGQRSDDAHDAQLPAAYLCAYPLHAHPSSTSHTAGTFSVTRYSVPSLADRAVGP